MHTKLKEVQKKKTSIVTRSQRNIQLRRKNENVTEKNT